MKHPLLIIFCLALTLSWTGGFAHAQTPALDEESVHMLQAVQKAMTGDYRGAEQGFSQVIMLNPRNADAYLQRGVMRRELKNMSGAQQDATAVIALSNEMLRRNPKDAEAYHQRGMAARLLGNYPQAKQDIQTAISLGGNPDWNNGLRDTHLEEMASKGIAN